tara:strand:- start:887 stop:1183 length:297 start_codon:yes stop_codon:yes gene_type:complete
MTIYRHAKMGDWPNEKNMCGAPRKPLPERYLSSEKYLHEVKACPKCKVLRPALKGWDEIIKENKQYSISSTFEIGLPNRVTSKIKKDGLYLRDYLGVV